MAAFWYLDARAALDAVAARGLTVVTAEACTAGRLALSLSELPGAAGTLKGGFVACSKEMTISALGVPAALIASKGAVSEEVAAAMARGALARAQADIAVAVTGVIGRDPDEDKTPVGVVICATARGDGLTAVRRFAFSGSAPLIMDQTVRAALQMLRDACLDAAAIAPSMTGGP